MTAELWQRLKSLYNQALDLPEDRRAEFVATQTAGEPELARELRALLANQSLAPAAAASNGHHPLESSLAQPFPEVARWPPRHPARLGPGALLAGRFRIVRHLGSGGMGDVYEASDNQMADSPIALKVIRPAIAANPAALARFKDEVRLARKVSGPNVCRIHELHLAAQSPNDDAGHPTVFLTMELLEGITLHERIAESTRLPVPELRAIATQLCTALGCIHEAGIVHGDLKPRNVMLVARNGTTRAVVMDFGLACVATEANKDAAAEGLGSGIVAGTPGYMAPEQFEGCADLTPATDIYAFGLILYEMATGIQPYAADTALAAAIRRGKPPAYASAVRHDLPTVWDSIITRCLHYDPKDRFPSAAALAEALSHSPTVVLRLGHERRLALPKTPIFAAAAVLLLALATTAWMLFARPKHRELAPDAVHWYARGMTALREGAYLRATHQLAMVTDRDPSYPLAHAALADAWNELDFTQNAQHEMLLASDPTQQRGLNDPERLYIDAVRATLVGNFAAALASYRAVLDQASADRKAEAWLDLGRLYDKAGHIDQALDAFQQAATLNPDDPAPLLHLAILRSRLRQPAAAQQAFAQAETLYRAESDQEGLAEVAYQQGYAGNQAGNFKQAQQFLNQSLTIARQIPSPQLEARTLTQLSSASYNDNRTSEAIQYAKQGLGIADTNGLEYWSTDSLIRLGNAYMRSEDFRTAEPLLLQASTRALQNGHPRLNASAQLSLASLCNQQKRFDEQISFARGALRYFQEYGFAALADQAQTLVLRGERDKGDFEGALQSGISLLTIANRTNSTFYIATAEELVGDTLMRLERYPEALPHFQQGMRELQSLGHDPAYQQLHTAEALFALGRISEAESQLSDISPSMQQRTDIGASIATLRAQIKESRENSRAALYLAEQIRQRYPPAVLDAAPLEHIELLGKAEEGKGELAQQQAAQLASVASAQGKPDEVARAELLQAQLAMMAGDGSGAKSHADVAARFFEAKHLWESRALSLLTAAEAAHLMGDQQSSVALSRKAIDIFQSLKQSWGTSAFRVYAGRPDHQEALRTLSQLQATTVVPSQSLLQ